jgi:hypothetical protein
LPELPPVPAHFIPREPFLRLRLPALRIRIATPCTSVPVMSTRRSLGGRSKGFTRVDRYRP